MKQLQEEFALVGTPDAVAEKLEWYGDELGVTEVIMRMQWMDMEQSAVLDSMHLIGERIIAAH